MKCRRRKGITFFPPFQFPLQIFRMQQRGFLFIPYTIGIQTLSTLLNCSKRVCRTRIVRSYRPLFQSMTYHDTSVKPLAEMRYLDTSARPGEKHHYTVVAVNSVGLVSAPSTK